MVDRMGRIAFVPCRNLLIGVLFVIFLSVGFSSCSRVGFMVRLSCLGSKDSTLINFGAASLFQWDTMFVIKGPIDSRDLNRIVKGQTNIDSFVEQVVVFKNKGEISNVQDWYFGYKKYLRPPYFLTQERITVLDRSNACFICFPISTAFVLVPKEEYDHTMHDWIENHRGEDFLRKEF